MHTIAYLNVALMLSKGIISTCSSTHQWFQLVYSLLELNKQLILNIMHC